MKNCLTVPFSHSNELSAFLSQLGFQVDIVQITKGNLQGSCSISIDTEITYLCIQSNQGLNFFGEYRPQTITIAIETSTNREYSKIQGENLPLSCMAGYGTNKDAILYSVSPGSCIFFMLLPSICFHGFSHQLSGEKVIDILQNSNILKLQPSHFTHLTSICKQKLLGGAEGSHNAHSNHDFMLLIHDIMASNAAIPGSYHTKNVDRSLIHQFMRLAVDDELIHPVTINDISKKLFTSKTNLSTHVRKAIGLSPMSFIKCARLEQVRQNLLRQQSNASVTEIANRFGFTSRGHFARDYKELFGERPSDTIIKNIA